MELEQCNCADGAAASEIQPQDLDHHSNCRSQALPEERVVAPAVHWPKSRQVFRLIPPAASCGGSAFVPFPSLLFGVIGVHGQRSATA